MPITGHLAAFTDYNISLEPNRMGVYALYQNGEPIYYGRATTSIRDRLQSHKSGTEGPCTKAATHFNTELTSQPIERERELLDEYRNQHGRLPKCNERVG